MPKIAYIEKRFAAKSEALIAQANTIIGEYDRQGFRLTLRQLYYHFIAHDLFPDSWIDEAYNARKGLAPNTKNTDKNYNRLGSLISSARKAGFIDWRAMEDRTRAPVSVPHWGSAREIIADDAETFRMDKWADQPGRVEVWIEKDALIGVIEDVCHELDVTYYSCRGYSSDPPVWDAAQRFAHYANRGQSVTVLHFGDHDPSGIDMTRDLDDRLALFGSHAVVERIALNRNQITDQTPPNPAKITDSRYAGYVAEHGDQSWELDALEPAVIAGLVREHVEALRDPTLWNQAQAREDTDRELLQTISDRYDDVVDFLQ